MSRNKNLQTVKHTEGTGRKEQGDEQQKGILKPSHMCRILKAKRTATACEMALLQQPEQQQKRIQWPKKRLRLELFQAPHPINPAPSFPSLSPLPGIPLFLGKRVHSFDMFTGEQLVGILNKEKDPELPICSHTMDVFLSQGCSLFCIPQNSHSV